MYSTIPKEWRSDFNSNVTIEELNATLVKLHIPTIVLISIFMCVGVFGNILVLIIYTNYKSSTYKSFIVWLGWMDLLACLVGKPALIISMLYPYISPSEILCRWSRFLHVFISVSAALIFLAISYERYKKICFMDLHQLSYKRVNIICLLAVISACIVAVPALFVFGDADVNTGVQNVTGVECFIDQRYKSSYLPKLYFLFQLLLCLISVFTMCIFYIRIWRTLRWHRTFVYEHTFKSLRCIGTQRNGAGRPPSNSENFIMTNLRREDDKSITGEAAKVKARNGQERFERGATNTADCTAVRNINLDNSEESVHKSQRNLLSAQANDRYIQAQNKYTKEITKMLFIVTVVFILAFLPHLVLMLTNALRPQTFRELSPAGVIAYTFFLRTFVINNMANPIVYFVCLGTFRSMCFHKFRKICRCLNSKENGTK
ncbi:orexin receptor type 2-like [Mercenaria mercenaria]|uniref:orexin receptor type 2-like n=1 Tax=Mercenaria mercenaria TaxID=6596 RepID=UPI00234E61A1|nr:orexin receptor type 2-like [Mercenaria mercenaria]